MGKKKTVFVWILLVVLSIVLIGQTIGFIIDLVNIRNLLTQNLLVNMIDLFLSLIALVLLAIFILKLYNVSLDVVKWVHILFSFSIFRLVVDLGFASIPLGFNASIVITYAVSVILVILMWGGITMHLKRTKRENLMDFS